MSDSIKALEAAIRIWPEIIFAGDWESIEELATFFNKPPCPDCFSGAAPHYVNRKCPTCGGTGKGQSAAERVLELAKFGLGEEAKYETQAQWNIRFSAWVRGMRRLGNRIERLKDRAERAEALNRRAAKEIRGLREFGNFRKLLHARMDHYACRMELLRAEAERDQLAKELKEKEKFIAQMLNDDSRTIQRKSSWFNHLLNRIGVSKCG